jgi:predicted nucleic acid-binding protein
LSFLFDHLPSGPVILDASAIINLLGTEDMPGVLRALGVHGMVEERTLDEIKRHPIDGQDHRAMFGELMGQGVLTVERMTEAEYETYLDLVSRSLAARLDSGESAAIALTHRGHAVILDENKARGIVARDFKHVHQTSTLRLLLTAGHRGGWALGRVQELVLAARRNARMGVPREEVAELCRLMDGVTGWPVI